MQVVILSIEKKRIFFCLHGKSPSARETEEMEVAKAENLRTQPRNTDYITYTNRKGEEVRVRVKVRGGPAELTDLCASCLI